MTVKELKEALAPYDYDINVVIIRDDTEDFEGGAFVVESVFYDEDSDGVVIDA
ncbi:MAG: hypothetical protein NC548_34620 [Lachnospiraceae bacterium]|nr:hypothetical protein [Lachnospiraceae bacterium]